MKHTNVVNETDVEVSVEERIPLKQGLKQKQGRERFLKLLAGTIKDPYKIWLTPMKENKTGRIVLRRRFVRGFSTGPDDKMTGFSVFEYGKNGWGGTTAFQPKTLNYVDKARNGVLLWKEK